MKLTTAIRQLKKQQEFLGVPFLVLIDDLEKAPLSFPNKVREAYSVYKQERNTFWLIHAFQNES